MAKTKIRKHGREYEPCPEVETYVVIKDQTNEDMDDEDEDEDEDEDGVDGVDEVNGKGKSAENNELKEDGDGIAVDKNRKNGRNGKDDRDDRDGKKEMDGDDKLDVQIKESIAHLTKCNVVREMTPKDIYWHIKMVHSECSIATLESEFNRNNGHYNGRQHREPQNSFDEVAEELLQNEIY